jgi:GxxExxY protein
MPKNIVHFSRNSNDKLDKFPNCPDSVISEEGLELYKKIKQKAQEVFDILGDSYREEIYTGALGVELELMGYLVEKEVECDVMYKNVSLGKIRADLVARGDETFVVESKRVDCYKGVMQLIGYMRNMNIPLGFAIGFQSPHISLWLLIDSFIFDGKHVRNITTHPSQ